jgi:purine-binding chemotaxis protein CheW
MMESLVHGGPEPAAMREMLVFRIGEQEFCIDLLAVRELRGWTVATPLPRSPDYMRGVINLRGTVLPILDVAARLGMATSEPTSRHVVIVVSANGQTLGLLVDGVCEIMDAAPQSLQPTPDVRSDTVSALVSALFTVDERMIGLLALDRLLPPPDSMAA